MLTLITGVTLIAIGAMFIGICFRERAKAAQAEKWLPASAKVVRSRIEVTSNGEDPIYRADVASNTQSEEHVTSAPVSVLVTRSD